MKKSILSIIIIITLIIISSSILLGQSKIYYTTDNFPACLYYTDIINVYNIAVTGDDEALMKYINDDNNYCFIMNGDIEVYLVETLDIYLKIRPKGKTIQLWTITGGIKETIGE